MISRYVADARVRQQLISTVHLINCPIQRVGRFLGIGDDFGEQMRYVVVLAHFDALGIDEDQADFFGQGSHQKRGDECVYT